MPSSTRPFAIFWNALAYMISFHRTCTQGRVVYTVFKELDFATSLLSGPYAQNRTLPRPFVKPLKLKNANDFVIVDFKQYLPSHDAPASFIASQLVDNKGTLQGVLIFSCRSTALPLS